MPKQRSSTIASSQSIGQSSETAERVAAALSERLSSRISDFGGSVSADYGAVTVEQRVDDAREEQTRELINSNYEDDEFFYTENEQAFLETLEDTHNEEIQYEYENVLNGNQATFGIEIEFVGGNANEIARELYDLGICGHSERVPYHSRGVEGKWKLEWDGSVSSGESGGEFVSPPLKDTPETWQTIEKICEIAKRHNATVSDRAGLHVHMSLDAVDTAKQRWKRMFRTIGGFEDVIYRVAGGDQGVVRSGVNHYATPFEQNAIRGVNQNMAMENDEHLNRMARVVSQGDRYQGVNLTNIYQANKPNTSEFRYFNSSLNPLTIQTNAKIASGIMFASNKARIGATSDSETMKKRGRILLGQRMGHNDRTNDEGVKKFVDVIFTRKKDKDAVLMLYAKNRWRNQ